MLAHEGRWLVFKNLHYQNFRIVMVNKCRVTKGKSKDVSFGAKPEKLFSV